MAQSSPVGRNHWETGPLVQWSFLQYKKQAGSKAEQPTPQFLHSATQVGAKIVIFGGCSYFGEPLRSLFIYDTLKFEWSAPSSSTRFEEDHPGARYSHSATLVESHPPKILVYGGMLGGGTFEFDSPDGVDEPGPEGPVPRRIMMNWRRKGRQNVQHEEMDESVYLLSLNAESWVWSKPLIAGTRSKGQKPPSRAEHSACKTSTNEVTIFGGWSDAPQGPSNDLWTFNYVDMEWKAVETSGIHPRQRYRHTAEMAAGKMYVLGGSDNGEDVADASRGNLSVHELDFGTMQWSHPALRGMNPFPRSGHGSCVIGANTLAVFGGKRSNDLFFNDLVLIDCGTWCTTVVNAVEACLPTPIGNCSVTNVGNKLFVFGGTDAKGACYNDIRSLDIGLYLSSSDITVGEGASSDYCFKILIIGDASVGKSAILTRFSEGLFLDTYTSTIGIDFNSKMIRVERAICKLEMWDTAGQERFSTITANYYRGAQGAMLVYDVGRRDSFDRVKVWYERAKQLGGQDLECVLVGNKADLCEGARQVSADDGQALASLLEVPFVETSALSGTNVEAAFVSLTSNVKRSVDRRGLTGLRSGMLQKAGGVSLAKGDRKMKMSERCCGGM